MKLKIADAEEISGYADKIIGGISQYYAAKYKRIKKRQEANQELTAGFLLKKYLNVCSEEKLRRAEHGKPELIAGKPYFNLSHSGKYVVLAIADREVGIDIEQIMPVHWPTVEKLFTKRQRERLEREAKKEQSWQFAALWTEYEAAIKLFGTGFAVIPEAVKGPEYLEDVRWFVHSMRYKNYMIACAAYEDFFISVEETRWTEE